MSTDLLSPKQLVAFAQDLQDSHLNRQAIPSDTTYALDANVMWFLQQQLSDEDEIVEEYIARAIGTQNAASLIRTSIETLRSNRDGLTMTEAHKFETDVAFASEVPADYDALRETLIHVLTEVISTHSASPNPRNLPYQVLQDLKYKHWEDYVQLTDILSHRPQRKGEIDRATRTLQIVKRPQRSPAEFEKTLKKIGFILRKGGGRPAFSVFQDIKALRDIAFYNHASASKRTVLLTFDKRLLQAVRLVRFWNEPWAEHLAIESAQTFWIWYLTDPEIAGRAEVGVLQEVMHDFRRKSRQLFSLVRSGEGAYATLWPGNRKTLKCIADWLSARREQLYSDETSTYKVELFKQVRELLDSENIWRVDATPEHISMIQNACSQFFGEVEEALPSFRLLISNVLDREQVLTHMLEKHGAKREAFLDAVNAEIQEHARSSLQILGASSLVAPKTIRAVYTFTTMDQGRPHHRRFIHRAPLPIQSDDFDLEEVVALVSNKQAKLATRYDRLMQVAALRGAVADLTVAYLLASSGSWADAEDICREHVSRSRKLTSQGDAVYYELRLLLAAVLRIYKTTPAKLKEAEKLLRDATQSKAPRPKSDPHDLRIRLELIAVQLNKILVRRYGGSTSTSSLGTKADAREAEKIVQSLMRLKEEIGKTEAYVPFLFEKYNANINANYFLARYFIIPEEADNLIDKEIHDAIVRESVDRLTRHSARISYFEEIVASFGVLRSADFFDGSFRERELVVSLRSRLSRVLQRDEKSNEFEYRIYMAVKEWLDVVGY